MEENISIVPPGILLCNYNNGSLWPVLPQNLFRLHNCLRRAGVKSDVLDFNLSKHRYSQLSSYRSNVIGLGFISGYWPHRNAIKFAEAVNSLPNRNDIKFIIGGHAPSAAPEYYKDKLQADAVFVGAADVSLPAWVDGGMPEGIIETLGYGDLYSPHEFEHQDIEIYKRVRFPNTLADEFAIQILSARGCPYKCKFCHRLPGGFAKIPTSFIMDSVMRAAVVHGVTHFQFSDELLMSDRARCEEVCCALNDVQRLIGRKLFFDCNGRLNVASKYPALLQLMKQTGFRYINYGCESMSQEVLDNIGKQQTVDEIILGVENTIKAGLSPGLNFMWGNHGDNKKTLSEAVKFIMKYGDGCELRTIRPVTPYPGTELFSELGVSVDEFYEKHTNSDLFSFQFMGMSNEDANIALGAANAKLYAHYVSAKSKKQLNDMKSFYIGATDPMKFRGFREV